MNPVVRSDIVVSAFLDSVGGYRHKERRDKLLDILDVDLDWSVFEAPSQGTFSFLISLVVQENAPDIRWRASSSPARHGFDVAMGCLAPRRSA